MEDNKVTSILQAYGNRGKVVPNTTNEVIAIPDGMIPDVTDQELSLSELLTENVDNSKMLYIVPKNDKSFFKEGLCSESDDGILFVREPKEKLLDGYDIERELGISKNRFNSVASIKTSNFPEIPNNVPSDLMPRFIYHSKIMKLNYGLMISEIILHKSKSKHGIVVLDDFLINDADSYLNCDMQVEIRNEFNIESKVFGLNPDEDVLLISYANEIYDSKNPEMDRIMDNLGNSKLQDENKLFGDFVQKIRKYEAEIALRSSKNNFFYNQEIFLN